MANIGLGQVRKDGYLEKPLITAGVDLVNIPRIMKETGDEGKSSYTAKDVLDYLLGK